MPWLLRRQFCDIGGSRRPATCIEDAVDLDGIGQAARINRQLPFAHEPAHIRTRDPDALGIGACRKARHGRSSMFRLWKRSYKHDVHGAPVFAVRHGSQFRQTVRRVEAGQPPRGSGENVGFARF
jgi:hypothetical protein